MNLANMVALLISAPYVYQSDGRSTRFIRVTRDEKLEVIADEYGDLFTRIVLDEPVDRWMPRDRWTPTADDLRADDWAESTA